MKHLKMYAKLSPWIRVMRLPLALLGVLMSIGLLLYSGRLFTTYGLGAFVVVVTMNISGNMYNEYVDIEDDKDNKPWRPLPQGEISEEAVLTVSLALYFSGWIVGLYLFRDAIPLFIMAVMMLSAMIYNQIDRGVIGTAFMSLCYAGAAMLCLYPGKDMWLFGLAFALFTYGFNIVVQAQDVNYDMKETIPKQIGGVMRSLKVSIGVMYLSMLFWFMLWFQTGSYLSIYILVFVTLIPGTLYAMYKYESNPLLAEYIGNGWRDMIERWVRGYTRVMLISVTVFVIVIEVVECI